MEFSTLDTLFNLALFVFWFRIWTPGNEGFLLNPYLAPLGGLADSALNFVTPVFGRVPRRWAAAAVLVALLVLRGLALPVERMAWVLGLGFQIREAAGGGLAAPLAFSGLSFALFLFKLWTLSLLYVPPRGGPAASLAHSALYYAARPFTDVWGALRPLVWLAFGMGAGWLLLAHGREPAALPLPLLRVRMAPVSSDPPALLPLKLALGALSGGVEAVGVAAQLMVWLILASWVFQLLGLGGAVVHCREWLSLLLGPMRRWSVRLGPLELAPALALLVLLLAQVLLQGLLLETYLRLP